MEVLFENICIRNRDMAKEVYGYYYFRRKGLVILYFILALSFFANILGFVFDEPFNFAVSIFVPVFFILQIIAYFQQVKTMLMRCEEIGEMSITTTVTDEFVQISAPSGSSSKLEYQNIKNAIQTKNLILLVTKAKLLYIFPKDKFTKGTSEEFIAFLRRKGIKVK